MNQADVYRELSKKMMLEHSKILPRIWESVCTMEEAKLLDLMPGTAEDLASKTGKDVTAVGAMLDSLFHKGAAFDAVKDGRRVFRMPRHIVQFHDASILWREAPPEMIKLWVEFMDTEFRQIPELATAAGLPAFMRIIPIGESLETRTRILVYEDAARMIEDASEIAVVDCTCRKSHRHCDKPVEVCLQLNRGAEYTRRRGTGRMIDRKEALAILRLSEDAGLVHATENKGGPLHVLCNCCTCCCEMMRFAKNAKTRGGDRPEPLHRVDQGRGLHLLRGLPRCVPHGIDRPRGRGPGARRRELHRLRALRAFLPGGCRHTHGNAPRGLHPGVKPAVNPT